MSFTKRLCSAWKSVSNFGSPLSAAWSTVIVCTPARVHCVLLNVLFAQTVRGNTQTPFTTPSASQRESPSVQRMFFGFSAGSLMIP